MKNNHAIQLKKARKKGYDEGLKYGIDFALAIATVALSEIYGFGYERIKRLENEINRLIIEEFDKDPEQADYQMAARIAQIRKRSDKNV